AIKPDLDIAWFNKACAQALIPNKDGAVSSLKKAIELNPSFKRVARTNPDFSKIKDDPDFINVVGR
ncbi:MAG TPA: TPR end-of-group domain-containing protein, partial [Candidatus Brocadiaceae bacterium]